MRFLPILTTLGTAAAVSSNLVNPEWCNGLTADYDEVGNQTTYTPVRYGFGFCWLNYHFWNRDALNATTGYPFITSLQSDTSTLKIDVAFLQLDLRETTPGTWWKFPAPTERMAQYLEITKNVEVQYQEMIAAVAARKPCLPKSSVQQLSDVLSEFGRTLSTVQAVFAAYPPGNSDPVWKAIQLDRQKVVNQFGPPTILVNNPANAGPYLMKDLQSIYSQLSSLEKASKLPTAQYLQALSSTVDAVQAIANHAFVYSSSNITNATAKVLSNSFLDKIKQINNLYIPIINAAVARKSDFTAAQDRLVNNYLYGLNTLYLHNYEVWHLPNILALDWFNEARNPESDESNHEPNLVDDAFRKGVEAFPNGLTWTAGKSTCDA